MATWTIRENKYNLNDEQEAGLKVITDAWLAETLITEEPYNPDRGKFLDNGHTGVEAELKRKYQQKMIDYLESQNVKPVEDKDSTS